MIKFNKNNKTSFEQNRTPILTPLITVDIMEDTGAKIRIGDDMKPLMKYSYTAEFYSQKEYDEFLKTLTNK